MPEKTCQFGARRCEGWNHQTMTISYNGKEHYESDWRKQNDVSKINLSEMVRYICSRKSPVQENSMTLPVFVFLTENLIKLAL